MKKEEDVGRDREGGEERRREGEEERKREGGKDRDKTEEEGEMWGDEQNENKRKEEREGKREEEMERKINEEGEEERERKINEEEEREGEEERDREGGEGKEMKKEEESDMWEEEDREKKRGEERERNRGEEMKRKRGGEREMKRVGQNQSLEGNNGDMTEEETGGRGEEKFGKVLKEGVKRGEWLERKMTGDRENANTRGRNEGNGNSKKRKVNNFDNVAVECTGFENRQEAFDFKPTNQEWRIRQCSRFNLPGPLHLPERVPSRHACQELANPKQVDHIVGDGNCLYRAISLEVCDTQNEHEAVRELIVDTIIRNEKSFSKYVGGDLGNYLSQHTLRPRSWGSDVEIFAAATLLQTTIVVFTQISPDCRKWLSHPPLFSIPGVLPSDERIYLSNLCSHFERVITV